MAQRQNAGHMSWCKVIRSFWEVLIGLAAGILHMFRQDCHKAKAFVGGKLRIFKKHSPARQHIKGMQETFNNQNIP